MDAHVRQAAKTQNGMQFVRRCAVIRTPRMGRSLYAIAYSRAAAVTAFGDQSTDECTLRRDERELVGFFASMGSNVRASARVWKLGAPMTEATLQTLLKAAADRQQTERLCHRVEAAQAELRRAKAELETLQERQSNARPVGQFAEDL